MRTNTAIAQPAIFTHEGAKAARIHDPLQQLHRTVMACMLFEDTFYEDGKAVADRMQEEVAAVLKIKQGARAVAVVAAAARNEMKLRHAPLLLLSTLAKANTADTRAELASAIATVVQRPDEMGELISLFWKDGKKMLPAQMKKGLALAFKKFNEYSLAKYDRAGDAIRLRDVLFLIHAKPDNEAQEQLWKKLIDGKLAIPDTWEVQLSGGADKKTTFERLLAEKKLGALALLRNLRNMVEAGVPMEAIREGLQTMSTERVLPFRFITAARYAPKLEPELENAMFSSLKDHPKLPGKTVLLVDNSGSMSYPLSAKSELRRVDAAVGLAMLLREVCEEIQIVVFGGTAGLVKPRRGFALADEIKNCSHRGGTNTQLGVMTAQAEGYDRLIILTDEQSSTPVPPPGKGKKGYIVNVASNRNGINYRDYVHVDGWSEAVVDYIRAFEQTEG
jgi:60 kDa SS-A/Ro ribonucleoprotein